MTSIGISHQQLEAALATLSERARSVYLLSARDGLSYSAIARQLGMTVAEVEQVLARALVALDRHYGANSAGNGVAPDRSPG